MLIKEKGPFVYAQAAAAIHVFCVQGQKQILRSCSFPSWRCRSIWYDMVLAEVAHGPDKGEEAFTQQVPLIQGKGKEGSLVESLVKVP